jgi:prolyl oligopeptidase
MSLNSLLLSLIAAAALCLITIARAGPGVETPKKAVTNEYQGVKVEDDYQWLENDADPAVKTWSDAQNQRTRAYLDKLPDRAAIEKQLTEWYAKA